MRPRALVSVPVLATLALAAVAGCAPAAHRVVLRSATLGIAPTWVAARSAPRVAVPAGCRLVAARHRGSSTSRLFVCGRKPRVGPRAHLPVLLVPAVPLSHRFPAMPPRGCLGTTLRFGQVQPSDSVPCAGPESRRGR